MQEFFLPNATDAELDNVLTLYSSDPTQGSPYGTGANNTLSPESKRMAAFLGDLKFHGTRRFFLNQVSGKQNTWSYCTLRLFPSLFVQVISSRTHVNSHIVSKRDKLLPVLGSAHSSDLPYIYGGADLTDYLINFVTNLNPNGPSLPYWPQYNTSSRQLLTLYDTPVPTNITLDTFREEGMQLLTELLLKNPL